MLLDVCFTFVSLNSPFFLQYLTLNVSQDSNNIGDDGARAIADAMRVNSSVQQLHLVRLCCRMLLDVCFTFVLLNFAFCFSITDSERFTGRQHHRRRRCQGDCRCDAREQQRAVSVPCAFVLLNAA